MREELPKASVQILLHKALTAHNTLANVDGTSPIQRATGLSPALPSVLTDTPASAAARENVPGNIPTYWDRLHVAVVARRAFNAAQLSRKLTRALAHSTRQRALQTSRRTTKFCSGTSAWMPGNGVGEAQRGWLRSIWLARLRSWPMGDCTSRGTFRKSARSERCKQR